MWFIIYSSYALAFWYGVELILQSRELQDSEYTPAVIVIVSVSFFSNRSDDVTVANSNCFVSS